MPAGRVQWIDEGRRVVQIARGRRVYPARLDDVDSRARVPNALVEFRVVRREGEPTATDVRLRAGTRTNRRQRRFGDLTGARRPGAKVPSRLYADYGVDTASPPFEVVEGWLEAMGDRDLDGAAELYLPDAILHLPDGDRAGRRQIRAGLEVSPLAGIDTDDIDVAVDVYGLGRYVRVDARAGEAEHGMAFVVDRGAIAEQWVVDLPTVPPAAAPPAPIQLVSRGPVPAAASTYAEHRIRHLVDTLGRPVRFGRVKLTFIDNPASERPAVAQAVLDLDRTMVRAQADAPTFTEAVDRVVGRLQAQVAQERSERRSRRRGRVAAHDEGETWPPAEADLRFGPREAPPAPDHPEIVRHRSYAPEEMTVDEAAWDLDLLDYDFLLFVESSTGVEALLERTDAGPFVLHLRDQPDQPPALDPDQVVLADDRPPELATTEAVDWLEGTDRPFCFHIDPTTDRANVIYRRLDGHYGLIRPTSGPGAVDG